MSSGGRVRDHARRAAACAAGLALRLSARKLGLALVYHAIDEATGPAGDAVLPRLDAHAFRLQLAVLRRSYRIVAAADLPREARARRRGMRIPVAVTFDDDLRSHADVAAPILTETGVDATFFLCGASLDGPRRFWWEHLEELWGRSDELHRVLARHGIDASDIAAAANAIQSLTPGARDALSEELRALSGAEPADSGLRADDVARLADRFAIGFHTRKHHPLTQFGSDQLEAAMRGGRADLERAAGRSLQTIAYPHGAADRRVAAAARAAGYACGFTTEGAAYEGAADPWLIGRLESSATGPGEFALQLTRVLRTSDRRATRGRRRSGDPSRV